MAEITSYPTADPKSGDYLLGAQVSSTGGNPATKKFTVGSVNGIPDNNGQLYNTVGLKFKWNTQDPAYQVSSTRVGPGYTGLTYPKLFIEFENLELKPGSTYGLLIERFKPRKNLTGSGSAASSPSSFKRMSNAGVSAPFDQRVFELPITTIAGEFFDFKFDLYYNGGAAGFPKPSGFPGVFDQALSVQYLAFRIVKRTGSVEKISPILGKLRMIGIAESNGAGSVPLITFGNY